MDAFALQPIEAAALQGVVPPRAPRRPRRAAPRASAAPDAPEADRDLLFSVLSHTLGCMEAAEAAEAALARFGGFAEAVAAEAGELERLPELGEAGAAALKAVHAAALRFDAIRTSRRPVLRDTRAVLAHLRAAGAPREGMLALFLDPRQRLMAEEAVPPGAPGRILRRALELQAEGILLVRWAAAPAEADAALARSLDQAARVMEIALRDYLVLGHGEPASLREAGVIGPAPGWV